MSDPFVGEIRMFAGNFAPRGWAFCDGQLLAISQNDALFSLLGTTYGGDGRTTFGLPDLRGRVPIHAGQGPGLSDRRLGQQAGSESVTLTETTLPPHDHPLLASTASADAADPGGRVTAAVTDQNLYGDGLLSETLNPGAVTPAGAAEPQPHDNVMPYLCVHFIIALFGIYPSRH
jgi:microcystin-dependent protein